MEIINIITTVFFVAIPLLVLLVTALFGFKRNIFQSGAKLIMTIISIFISAVIVKYGVPVIVSDSLDLLNGIVSMDIIGYLQASDFGVDIIRMASTFIMPIVFLVVFILIAIVFSILYLIPGRLLSNKAFARRAAKKLSGINTEVTADSDIPEPSSGENQSAKVTTKVSESEKASIDWCKVGLRTGSVFCSVFSGFLVLACLATPLNAYSELIETISDGLNVPIIEEMDVSTREVLDTLAAVNEHPVNQCYKPFNRLVSGYFDRFTAHDGTKVIVSDTIVSAGAIVNSISNLGSDSVNAELFYSFANQIGEDPFICNMLSGLISDMCRAWGRGESFLGVTPLEFGNASISSLIIDTLADCDDVTAALRVVGDTLALQQSMQSSGNGATMIQQVFNGITVESADLLKNFMSEEALSELTGMPVDMASNVSTFIDGVLNGIIEIKEDSSLSDTEKTEILKQEAEALTAVLELTQTPENMNADNLVGAIIDSKVLTGTIQKLTQNGTVSDPYNIADALPTEFVSEVRTKLVDEGISEGSDLYNSIMAMISK